MSFKPVKHPRILTPISDFPLLGDLLHLVRNVPTGCLRRKRFAVFMVQSDGFFDDLATLIKHRLFVRAVAAAIMKAGELPT